MMMMRSCLHAGIFLAVVAQAHRQLPLLADVSVGTEDHYAFEPLQHLPGISPYFDSRGYGLPDQPPPGCKVTAASYIVRHSAIYANDDDYEKFMEPFLSKFSMHPTHQWTGPLVRLQNWKTPIDNPDNQLEELTPDGAAKAKEVALHLLRRYPELVPTTRKIYSDTKPRTRDTAKAFMEAFEQDIDLVQLSKHGKFQAIIPHKFCPKFSKASGDEELEQYISHYTKSIISRLQPHAPFELTGHDIVGMQQWCGYESAITGNVSSLCDIFTPIEWLQYEYAWDLKYSFMVGHGNPLSPYLGFPWLNITANLISKLHAPHDESLDPEDDNGQYQRFYLAFTHREVPPMLATALGLFNSSSSASEEFPTNAVNFQRAWKMSELIPFLGHVGIENLQCDATSGAQHGHNYIRFMANSAPRPVPACQEGPGASCPVHRFLDIVEEGLKKYGDFAGVCGIGERDGPISWQ